MVYGWLALLRPCLNRGGGAGVVYGVDCGVYLGMDLREGEARVGERIEAFVDDGLVPLELEEHP